MCRLTVYHSNGFPPCNSTMFRRRNMGSRDSSNFAFKPVLVLIACIRVNSTDFDLTGQWTDVRLSQISIVSRFAFVFFRFTRIFVCKIWLLRFETAALLFFFSLDYSPRASFKKNAIGMTSYRSLTFNGLYVGREKYLHDFYSIIFTCPLIYSYPPCY